MFNNKRIFAVIPARFGSKRIKNKNIKKFKGTIIYYTLKNAKSSKMIDKVIVSTDSVKILNICRKYGVDTPFLRKKIFGDKSPIHKATLFSINQAEKYFGKFDIVVQLMPNCPFRTTKTINKCIKNFFNKKFDSQISFSKPLFSNYWWAHRFINNRLKPINKKNLKKRSQDLENLYVPNGSIWISKISKLKKKKSFYSDNYGHFFTNFIESIDIDNTEEFEFAESLKHEK